MGPKEDPTRTIEVSDEQLRAEMIKAGIWLSFACCGAGFAYVLATWSEPNRQLISIMFGAGLAGAVLIKMLPLQKLMRRKARAASVGDFRLDEHPQQRE